MAFRNDKGFTLIELLIVVAIISVIASFAIPGLLRARMAGNEASAIASLNVTAKSQVAYATSCGNGGYAAGYLVLAAPAPGSTIGFISADLGGSATPAKTGYSFTLGPGAGSIARPNDCNGAETISAWYATAIPQTFAITGTRSFAISTNSTIWQNATAVAPTEPFGAPSTPVQ